MNQRKLNISRWCVLGLAVLLIMGCMVLAVGPAWARYRSEYQQSIFFESRVPLAAAVGTMDPENGFTQKGTLTWENQNDGSKTLKFAIANVTGGSGAAATYHQEDLRVRIRLFGSLAAWDENQVIKATLTDANGTVINARVTRIPADSALQHTFGDGWLFEFLDTNYNEMTWKLKGGVLSCAELTLTLSGAAVQDTSLLQLQVVAEVIY